MGYGLLILNKTVLSAHCLSDFWAGDDDRPDGRKMSQ
jgi:hypothetical protein